MSQTFRVKCTCGNVMNAAPGNICSDCKKVLEFPKDGVICLYRKGSPFGIAGGFGIYIDGQAMGYIGNKETVLIPVNYGNHILHVAAGMNRRCNDMSISITPKNPFAYAKVWMRPGAFTNSFVLEQSTAEEMPSRW